MTVMTHRIRYLRHVLALVAAIVLGLGSTGCPTKPTMELHSASLRGASTQGVLLNITMSVHNANSFDIMVRNVTADVTIAGRHRLPTVVASPNVWLPSDETTAVTVPVVIPWSQIAPIVATAGTSPRIGFVAIGRADVTATRALEIDINEYQLQETGSFSRAELVAAGARGLPGARIEVRMAM
jgi:LEA14-like dessication related protein